MGRPKLSEYDKFLRHQDYFLQVASVRREIVAQTGKKCPIKTACGLIVERGGLAWVRIAHKPDRSLPRRINRRLCDYDPRSGRLVNAKNGPIQVDRRVVQARSIGARYEEAVRLYREDRNVARAWDNMLADLTGTSRQPPLIRIGGQYKLIVERDGGYFVENK